MSRMTRPRESIEDPADLGSPRAGAAGRCCARPPLPPRQAAASGSATGAPADSSRALTLPSVARPTAPSWQGCATRTVENWSGSRSPCGRPRHGLMRRSWRRYSRLTSSNSGDRARLQPRGDHLRVGQRASGAAAVTELRGSSGRGTCRIGDLHQRGHLRGCPARKPGFAVDARRRAMAAAIPSGHSAGRLRADRRRRAVQFAGPAGGSANLCIMKSDLEASRGRTPILRRATAVPGADRRGCARDPLHYRPGRHGVLDRGRRGRHPRRALGAGQRSASERRRPCRASACS